MSFEWTDQLSTGIAEIDSQHKIVIRKFNDLIVACRQKKGNEEIKEFLQRNMTESPVACHGDECHPCPGGYKGDRKFPLSAETIA